MKDEHYNLRKMDWKSRHKSRRMILSYDQRIMTGQYPVADLMGYRHTKDWENKDKICSSFSSRAFSGVIFEAMNWKWSCRYQCRGICRGEENARFLIFELDESRILIGKNQYEQIEGRSMDLKCRLYRSKWIQSIAASDVMKSGQVVENPMIGAIPSRNTFTRFAGTA